MNLEIKKIRNRLLKLQSSFNEDTLLDTLYELTDELETIEGAFDLMPDIFNFIETHSEIDLGSPGPLVHFIEQYYPKYDVWLLESVSRKPTHATLWMCNRILNDNLEKPRRIRFLKALEEVANDKTLDSEIREDAMSFLKQQLGSS